MASVHELAQRDYILGLKYREIAEKYNVSIDTVKSWKTRYGWERDKPAKKDAHNAHKNKSVCTMVKEPEEELSDKEQLFCYHYVRTWNATQAALLAGYAQNKASAAVTACRLLQKPRVKAEVDRLRKLFRQEIYLDIQDFLAFCLKVVGADIGDYLKFGQKEVPVLGMFGPVNDPETGEPMTQMVNYVDLSDSNQVDTSILSEVKQGKDGVSIKLADKKWAWEQLIRYFDWLPDKWRRKIEEEKLRLEEQKQGGHDGAGGVPVQVVFNMRRPTQEEIEDRGDTEDQDQRTV